MFHSLLIGAIIYPLMIGQIIIWKLYLNFSISSNLPIHPTCSSTFVHLKSFFQILHGTIRILDSGYPYCIFHMIGELQLPNLEWYYWAAQISAGMFYFERNHPPAWVSIESRLINIPLNLYVLWTSGN